MTEDSVPVLIDHAIEARGMVSPLTGAVRLIENVNLRALCESFNKIVTSLNEVADAPDAKHQKFCVAEIDVSLEIDAKAGFVLVGTGSAGAKSAIRLTLRPRESR
jgi:hypothetical protein